MSDSVIEWTEKENRRERDHRLVIKKLAKRIEAQLPVRVWDLHGDLEAPRPDVREATALLLYEGRADLQDGFLIRIR